MNNLFETNHADLHLHPQNARRVYVEIPALAASIAVQGIQEPLVVVARAEGGYTVVDGNRRLKALQHLGAHAPFAPCRLVELSPAEQLLYMATSFLQREDIDPISEGLHYRRILDADPGLTQTALAQRLGTYTSRIAHRLKLLELDPEIQGLIASGKLHKSVDLAKALLDIPDCWRAERVALAQKLAESGVTVRSAANAARKLKARLATRVAESAKPNGKTNGKTHGAALFLASDDLPALTGEHGAAVSMALHRMGVAPAGAAAVSRDVVRAMTREVCQACDQYAQLNSVEPAWALIAHTADEVCEDCGLATVRGSCRACPVPMLVCRLASRCKEPA